MYTYVHIYLHIYVIEDVRIHIVAFPTHFQSKAPSINQYRSIDTIFGSVGFVRFVSPSPEETGSDRQVQVNFPDSCSRACFSSMKARLPYVGRRTPELSRWKCAGPHYMYLRG